MRTEAIIQARMTSTRLPGKVLMDICGSPMLCHVVERVSRCSSVDSLTVATSVDRSDDPIEQFCVNKGIRCFRGELDDVLNRFHEAARHVKADVVVRVTADCPLIDSEVMAKVIKMYLSGGYDYVSNVYPPTYPDGLDVEVFGFNVLETAWREAVKPSDRRHVTAFISENPDRKRFRIGNVENERDLSRHRWTVDTPEDLKLVRVVVSHFGNNNYSMNQVVDFLDSHPEYLSLNSDGVRNESYLKELEEQKRLGI